MVRTHQPGQAIFKSILPEDIHWKPFPAFPPSVRLAVVVGQPSEPGPYTIRVKVPSGVKLMPHRHPEDRVYTVMSGIFYIGLGDQFDGDKLQAPQVRAHEILEANRLSNELTSDRARLWSSHKARIDKPPVEGQDLTARLTPEISTRTSDHQPFALAFRSRQR